MTTTTERKGDLDFAADLFQGRRQDARVGRAVREQAHRGHRIAIYAARYNFRIQKTFRVTPAIRVGICDTVMKWEDLLAICGEQAPRSGR